MIGQNLIWLKANICKGSFVFARSVNSYFSGLGPLLAVLCFDYLEGLEANQD